MSYSGSVCLSPSASLFHFHFTVPSLSALSLLFTSLFISLSFTFTFSRNRFPCSHLVSLSIHSNIIVFLILSSASVHLRIRKSLCITSLLSPLRIKPSKVKSHRRKFGRNLFRIFLAYISWLVFLHLGSIFCFSFHPYSIIDFSRFIYVPPRPILLLHPLPSHSLPPSLTYPPPLDHKTF